MAVDANLPGRTDGLAALAADALQRILDNGDAAEGVLARTLRTTGLTGGDRAALARRVLGTVCLRRRLDHLLGEVPAPERNRWRLAAYVLTEEGSSPEHASALAGLPRGTEGRLAALRARPPPWPEDPVERLAAERSLPDWLAGLWLAELGREHADALAAAMNQPGPIAVRTNALRSDREQLARELAREEIAARPCSFSPWGLHLLGRPNVFGSSAWRGGLFEVQDEGSQLVALATGAQPGMLCVDFCAGSGGKTLALAAMMRNEGLLVALDVDAARLRNLPPRIKRAGVRIARIVNLSTDPDVLERHRAAADVVLVDTPCSALGVLRRAPDARWRIDPAELPAFSALQIEILSSASGLVRPGGRLVYATCTLRRVENEGVAAAFEQGHPSFRRLAARELLGTDLAGRIGAGEATTLMPHLHGTDGFFFCGWRRG